MVTTYTKLIKGENLSLIVLEVKRQQAKRNGDSEAEKRYGKEYQEHLETLSRYMVARESCGDSVVTVVKGG